jgi:aspartate racemase
MNDTPVIGVLGGMGPHAGAHFLQRLIALNDAARRDQDHPRVLLYSNSKIPDRVDALLGTGSSPLPEILASLDLLANGGAHFAAIVCNTAHAYIDEIRAHARLPLVDMIAATADELQRLRIRRVAMLATVGTVHSGVYNNVLEAAGIGLTVPDARLQAIISAAIFDRHRGIKVRSSPCDPHTLDQLAAVANTLLESGEVDTLLIACTELSIAFHDPQLAHLPGVDALDATARACLSLANGVRSDDTHVEDRFSPAVDYAESPSGLI